MVRSVPEVHGVQQATRGENLIACDKAVRSAAAQEGASKFGVVDSTLVMQHLGFNASATSRRPNAASSASNKPKRPGYCYHYNGGVPCDGARCHFLHVCSNCGDPSHTQQLSKKPKQGQAAAGPASTK